MIPFMRSRPEESEQQLQEKQIPPPKRYQLHEVTLKTVEEVIEAAFDDDRTFVNFKMMEVVLLVLANSLHMLDRKVALNLPDVEESAISNSISLKEIKVQTRPQSAKGKRKKSAKNVVSAKNKISSKPSKIKKSKDKEPRQTGGAKRIHQIFPTTSQQAMKTAEKIQVTGRGQQTERSSKASIVSRISFVKNKLKEKLLEPYEHLKSEKSELLRQIYHPMSDVDEDLPKVCSLHLKRESQGDFKSAYEWKTLELGSCPDVTTSKKGVSIDESWVGSKHFFSDTSCENNAKAAEIEKKASLSSKARPQKKKPQREKIIIVEFPSENFESPFIYETERKSSLKSMVTTEQLNKLSQDVSLLEEKFSQFDPTEENELLEILHKRSSISSPVSMLQLSAKLEVVESTSQKIYDILHNWMANKKTVHEPQPLAEEVSSILWEPTRETGFTFPIDPVIACYARAEVPKQIETEGKKQRSSAPEQLFTYTKAPMRFDKANTFITPYEFKTYCRTFAKEMMNAIHSHAHVIGNVGDKVVQSGRDLQHRLQNLFTSIDQMEDMEAKILNFSEKIDVYDTRLSQEMSNCQEELTGMQHLIMTACDNLAEYIMNMKMDTKEAEDLHTKFSVFHYNIDETAEMQDDIKFLQNKLASDVSTLWNKYQRIKKDKYDRFNLKEALATKAGFEVLNQFMSFDNYYAVFGYIHNAIERCLSEVHCTEVMWQRNLDELFKNVFNKADSKDIKAMEVNFDQHVAHLQSKLQFMFDIARREPEPSTVKKHEKYCLGCGSKPNFPPKTKEPPTVDDSLEQEKNNTAAICFFSRPVPRNHQCPRPCGRYYKAPTLEENIVVTKVPIINLDQTRKEVETAEKDDNLEKIPCLPCSSYSHPLIIRISKMPKRYIDATKERIQAPGKGAEIVTGAVEEEITAESHKDPIKKAKYYY